jgi:hypothetical protein
MGNVRGVFEFLSSQSVQLISQLNCCSILVCVRALVPAAQLRTQLWQEELRNRLMDSRRMRPFKHLKQIVHAYQRADLAQCIGKAASFRKVALITFLQLRVREIHHTSSMHREGVSDIGPMGAELKPGR